MVLPVANPTKSFWIEAANEPRRNHRSTPDLPKEVDIVIIGSGYTGAAAAKFTEHGVAPSMLMLEARDICGSATGRNGGQLRPHYYSRYPTWSKQFGPDGALAIIQHEVAHLRAFQDLMDREGIAEEVSFKIGNTFDAAMTAEAWDRLKGALDLMVRDHGVEGDCVRDCWTVEDPKQAEASTQMKGCRAAVFHPSGQVWPYKFVHALLKIVEARGCLNIQANTPVTSVSERNSDGRITVRTERGLVRAKTVLHATNRWASHLLPEFSNLIYAGRGTLAAIKAPEAFLKSTGAQHFDAVVNNYHLQLPAPYNTIIVGGAKAVTVKDPRSYIDNDREDTQFDGVPEYYSKWPKKDIKDWNGGAQAQLEANVEDGGVWSGVYSSSIDAFPFVGPVPDHKGQYIAAGFHGHGMPRILLSALSVAPQLLQSLNMAHQAPEITLTYPPLPGPFHVTAERIKRLQRVDLAAQHQVNIDAGLASHRKGFALPDSLAEGLKARL